MALLRRDLIFASALLLPAIRNARGAEAMTRVLVVGDSQAQGLAGGLQRQLRGDASWRVIDRSRIATGLCSPTRFNWPAAAVGVGEAERGAIAVVMFGANDRPPVHVHGHVDDKLATSFATLYGAR